MSWPLESRTKRLSLLPYTQVPYRNQDSNSPTEEIVRLEEDSAVQTLRNLHRADLVMLVGWFQPGCGSG